jgi:hypothetical protein
MRMLQRIADRLVSRLVPEVTASAYWYWETRCYSGLRCPPPAGPRYQAQRRYCHDGSNYCRPWENLGCCSL